MSGGTLVGLGVTAMFVVLLSDPRRRDRILTDIRASAGSAPRRIVFYAALSALVIAALVVAEQWVGGRENMRVIVAGAFVLVILWTVRQR